MMLVLGELVCLVRWVHRCINDVDEAWASILKMGWIAAIEAGSLLGVLVHIWLNHGLDKGLDVEVVLGGRGLDLAKFVRVAHTTTLVAFTARADRMMVVALVTHWVRSGVVSCGWIGGSLRVLGLVCNGIRVRVWVGDGEGFVRVVVVVVGLPSLLVVVVGSPQLKQARCWVFWFTYG